MSAVVDHYAVMGLRTDASSKDIKLAYRDLCKKWHPDKNIGQVDLATKKFQLIAEAYSTLNNPSTRREHDDDLRAAGMWSAAKRRDRAGGYSARASSSAPPAAAAAFDVRAQARAAGYAYRSGGGGGSSSSGSRPSSARKGSPHGSARRPGSAQRPCYQWAARGTCKYGSSCRYAHDDDYDYGGVGGGSNGSNGGAGVGSQRQHKGVCPTWKLYGECTAFASGKCTYAQHPIPNVSAKATRARSASSSSSTASSSSSGGSSRLPTKAERAEKERAEREREKKREKERRKAERRRQKEEIHAKAAEAKAKLKRDRERRKREKKQQQQQQQQQSTTPLPVPPMDSWRGLGVGKIKAILSSHRVAHEDCVEKVDLYERLRDLQERLQPGSTAAFEADANKKPEHNSPEAHVPWEPDPDDSVFSFEGFSTEDLFEQQPSSSGAPPTKSNDPAHSNPFQASETPLDFNFESAAASGAGAASAAAGDSGFGDFDPFAAAQQGAHIFQDPASAQKAKKAQTRGGDAARSRKTATRQAMEERRRKQQQQEEAQWRASLSTAAAAEAAAAAAAAAGSTRTGAAASTAASSSTTKPNANAPRKQRSTSRVFSSMMPSAADLGVGPATETTGAAAAAAAFAEGTAGRPAEAGQSTRRRRVRSKPAPAPAPTGTETTSSSSAAGGAPAGVPQGKENLGAEFAGMEGIFEGLPGQAATTAFDADLSKAFDDLHLPPDFGAVPKGAPAAPPPPPPRPANVSESALPPRPPFPPPPAEFDDDDDLDDDLDLDDLDDAADEGVDAEWRSMAEDVINNGSDRHQAARGATAGDEEVLSCDEEEASPAQGSFAFSKPSSRVPKEKVPAAPQATDKVSVEAATAAAAGDVPALLRMIARLESTVTDLRGREANHLSKIASQQRTINDLIQRHQQQRQEQAPFVASTDGRSFSATDNARNINNSMTGPDLPAQKAPSIRRGKSRRKSRR